MVVANLPGEGRPALLTWGALISLTVILVRFIWVFPVTYLPRWLWPPLRKREAAPNWKPAFLVGYTGLRGAVSLAAALSVPLTLGAAPFAHRDIMLFTTICVIVATLVIPGAALPRIVEWLGLGRVGAREDPANRRAENAARVQSVEAILVRLAEVERGANHSRAAVGAL